MGGAMQVLLTFQTTLRTAKRLQIKPPQISFASLPRNSIELDALRRTRRYPSAAVSFASSMVPLNFGGSSSMPKLPE